VKNTFAGLQVSGPVQIINAVTTDCIMWIFTVFYVRRLGE